MELPKSKVKAGSRLNSFRFHRNEQQHFEQLFPENDEGTGLRLTNIYPGNPSICIHDDTFIYELL